MSQNICCKGTLPITKPIYNILIPQTKAAYYLYKTTGDLPVRTAHFDPAAAT